MKAPSGIDPEHLTGEPPKPLSREEMWSQLTNAATLRSSEDQVLWIIFGTFWAANLLLLVALFQSGDLPSEPIIGVIVSLVGILLSRTWHIIQNRGLGHLMRFEKLMHTLEDHLIVKSESKFAASGKINKEDYDRFLPTGPSARVLMQACSKWATRLWLLSIAYFLWSVLHAKFSIL